MERNATVPGFSVEDVCRQNDMLSAENENWRGYHQEVLDFCNPRNAFMTMPRNPGDRLKFNHLYDSTGIKSLKIFTAGFHANHTNPASIWFDWVTDQIELKEDKDVKMFFAACRDIQLATLNKSNFNTCQRSFYENLGSLGTGVTLQLEDFQNVCRFNQIPLDQINLEEDAFGRIIAVYRNFKLKAIQAYALWKEKAGKEVVEAITAKKYNQEFEFLHVCKPRDYYDHTKMDSLNMPIASMWINKKEKHLIKESGFTELPYHVGRYYKAEGTAFGYSPAMDILSAMRLINAQKRTTLRAAMKATDPAMHLPSRGFMLPLNLNPGALNYRLEGTGADSLTAMPTGNAKNFGITLEMMKMEREDIEEAFFVPLFKAMSRIDKEMTVPEVNAVIRENMILLGPVVGETMPEYMGPLLVRNFNMHLAAGKFPAIPEKLLGTTFQPIYLSPLAKAQRESELVTLERFFGAAASVAQIKGPQVLDKIDGDKSIDLVAEIMGVNPKVLVAQHEVELQRKVRAEEQAKMAQANMIAGGAKVANDLAGAQQKAAQAEKVAA